MTGPAAPLTTPDGRYIVVRGRLWRRANPDLDPDLRRRCVDELMAARRAVGAAKRSGDAAAEASAHAQVDAAKRALGERGPVWWRDGAPDLNRPMARTTAYAEWFARQARQAGHASGTKSRNRGPCGANPQLQQTRYVSQPASTFPLTRTPRSR